MATIDKLMKGKKPGEIKIRRKSWKENSCLVDYWFQPYFRAWVPFEHRWTAWCGAYPGDKFAHEDPRLSDWEIWYPDSTMEVREWIYCRGDHRVSVWLTPEQETPEITRSEQYVRTWRSRRIPR